MPGISDIAKPWFWIARLRTALQALVDGWPSDVPGGLDAGQREVPAQALADAIAHREPIGLCDEGERRGAGLCDDHAADLDLTDAYLYLARELGIEVEQ